MGAQCVTSLHHLLCASALSAEAVDNGLRLHIPSCDEKVTSDSAAAQHNINAMKETVEKFIEKIYS